MSTFLWATASFLMGVLVHFGAGVLVGPMLSRERREWLGNKYFTLAMASMGRVLIAVHNELVTLHKSTFDAEIEQEQITVNGEKRWFNDPLGLMATFCKKPLGLVDTRYGIVVNPMVADILEHRNKQHERGDVTAEVGDEALKTPYTNVPAAEGLVDIRAIGHGLWASAYPTVPDTVDSYVEKMHQLYKSRDMMKDMAIVMAFGVGFGLVILADYLGATGGGGGSPIRLPMLLAPWGWL